MERKSSLPNPQDTANACGGFSTPTAEKPMEEIPHSIGSLLDGIPEAVLITDCDRVIDFCNEKSNELFACTTFELRGSPLESWIVENNEKSKTKISYPGFPFNTESGKKETEFRKIGRRHDGSTFPMVIKFRPIHLTGKLKFVAVIQDISKKRQLEKELARAYQVLDARVKDRTDELVLANRKLARINKGLDEFSYIVSHDLKSPLRGIYNYSNFLKNKFGGKLGENGQNWLNSIERLVQRMERQIDDILNFSKVSRTELNLNSVDLNIVLKDALETLHALITANQIDIKVPRSLPKAKCDRILVHELFLNLIGNAIKFNNKNKRWIEIGIKNSGSNDQESGHGNSGQPLLETEPVVFYIRDNGIGIKEDHRNSIFTIFKSLNPPGKFGDGTGVGLTIAAKIIDLHHGKIWVKSEEGQGTTFYFTLHGKNNGQGSPTKP